MTLPSMPAIKTTIFLQDECSKMTVTDNSLKVIRSTLPLDIQLDSNFSFTFMKGMLVHRKTYISSLEYQNELTKAHSDT